MADVRITNEKELEAWLKDKPREWAVAIAARAVLRIIPLFSEAYELKRAPKDLELTDVVLVIFRCVAVSRLFAIGHKISDVWRAALSAKDAASRIDTEIGSKFANDRNSLPSFADDPEYSRSSFVFTASAFSAAAAAASVMDHNRAIDFAADIVFRSLLSEPVEADILALQTKKRTQAITGHLWRANSNSRADAASMLSNEVPSWAIAGWNRLKQQVGKADNWQVWTDWYEDILEGRAAWGLSHEAGNEIMFEALTWPEEEWKQGPAHVNQRIAELIEKARAGVSGIPSQATAPVVVEVRDRQIAAVSNRESVLHASERDFEAWRAPVVGHIDELLSGDFKQGTNHSRTRDRLSALSKALRGTIADVKERQFTIGYEVERMEGLVKAYRSGADDMPALPADVLEDFDRLRLGLKLGNSKLDRWADFQQDVANDETGIKPNPVEVAIALEAMANSIASEPKYFNPELPNTFRWLAEAVRDPMGATKSVVFGAVRSGENLLIFLAQRAIGIGAKGIQGVEDGISNAVAKSLLVGLSAAALQLSGALPQGLLWLKPVLEQFAKSVGG